MMVEDCFRIGSIIKTRGLKGEVQAFIDFEDPDRLKFDTIFAVHGGKLVPYFIESFKMPQKNTAYIYLEDVDTIDKAMVLIKKDIYLPNKLKPKKKKNDFGIKDLKGFIAVDIDEGELGEIIEVLEMPQQFIATVAYKEKEVLFPLNEATIKNIDMVKNIVTVNLPEGLLDIYLE
jgi:16S rRNA processing protein RimM